MGFKNCFCNTSLRSGTLLIGWIYLIDQLFWLTVLVGSATYVQDGMKNDFPVQNDFTITAPPVLDHTFSEENLDFEKVLVDMPVIEKEKTEEEKVQGIPGIETMEIQIDAIPDSSERPVENSKKVLFIPENSFNERFNNNDFDYDVDPIWNFFLFNTNDKMNDNSKFDDHISSLNDHLAELDDHFSKMDDQFSKMDDDMPKLDDSFAFMFQDPEEMGKDVSNKPGDFLTLDDFLKPLQIRNKRDVKLVSEGIIQEMKVDTPGFILNAIILAFTIFFTILLIVGALKAYRQLLMIWIINTSFLTVLYTSSVITMLDNYFIHPNGSNDTEQPWRIIIFNLLRIIVHICMIIIVSRHHKELKQEEKNENSLKYFIDNNSWTTSAPPVVPVISEKNSKESV